MVQRRNGCIVADLWEPCVVPQVTTASVFSPPTPMHLPMPRVMPAFVLAALALFPVMSRAGLWELISGRRDLDVITVTDMSGAGQFLNSASPERPRYYIAASLGYRDLGPSIGGGSEPPPDKDVIHLISSELAKQGYLPAKSGVNPPSLMLFYTWGTLNTDHFYGADPSYRIQLNRHQMVQFLGGRKVGIDDYFFDPLTAPALGLTVLGSDAQNILEVAREDLYVVVVSAYELDTTLPMKRRPPLWTTRISAPSLGFSLSNVLPSMLAIGGQQFGRNTPRPVRVNASDQFKPSVRLGELQLLGYLGSEPLSVADMTDVRIQKK